MVSQKTVNFILEYYIINYFSRKQELSEDFTKKDVKEWLGLENFTKERETLFDILHNYAEKSLSSGEENSCVAGFSILKGMFRKAAPFLPPETGIEKKKKISASKEYTLPGLNDVNLLLMIAKERLNGNEGAIITGGFLGERLCSLFYRRTTNYDPFVIYSNALYTVANNFGVGKTKGFITSDIIDIFLPRENVSLADTHYSNARMLSGVSAALLCNPNSNYSNLVYLMRESGIGNLKWGGLSEIKVKYSKGSNGRLQDMESYSYTEFVLLDKSELESRKIIYSEDMTLPGNHNGTYLVKITYTLDIVKLHNLGLKLQEQENIVESDIPKLILNPSLTKVLDPKRIFTDSNYKI